MTSIKGLLIIALGFSVALLSLWVGTYFLLTSPKAHWSELPTMVTTVIGIIIGTIIIEQGTAK